MDLHWQDGNHMPVNTVTLDISITNDAGVLGRICTVIGEQQSNISDLNFIDRKPDHGIFSRRRRMAVSGTEKSRSKTRKSGR